MKRVVADEYLKFWQKAFGPKVSFHHESSSDGIVGHGGSIGDASFEEVFQRFMEDKLQISPDEFVEWLKHNGYLMLLGEPGSYMVSVLTETAMQVYTESHHEDPEDIHNVSIPASVAEAVTAVIDEEDKDESSS